MLSDIQLAVNDKAASKHKETRLEFVVTNDPELDFDLVQEVWLADRLIAVLRQVAGDWQVTFIPDGDFCQLSWQDLMEIRQAFSIFISESKQAGVFTPEFHD
ncbi:MAG: hypothetical protein GDA43_18055 [Hormoscilla sp. SP5CHS1]|nr:hypothetical protein [Hormoscilla sp. SP12CHS1]MBC6454867.1 hypothetical protein [Hormoscilla sp. SP5CHS1]MBC6471817.1 hypothetical protein [Hormoscilla sp. GM102CHS1]